METPITWYKYVTSLWTSAGACYSEKFNFVAPYFNSSNSIDHIIHINIWLQVYPSSFCWPNSLKTFPGIDLQQSEFISVIQHGVVSKAKKMLVFQVLYFKLTSVSPAYLWYIYTFSIVGNKCQKLSNIPQQIVKCSSHNKVDQLSVMFYILFSQS